MVFDKIHTLKCHHPVPPQNCLILWSYLTGCLISDPTDNPLDALNAAVDVDIITSGDGKTHASMRHNPKGLAGNRPPEELIRK